MPVRLQLPVLLKQVNLHSGLFLAILTLGYAATLCGYFIISDIEAVDGMMVRRKRHSFSPSRILSGESSVFILFKRHVWRTPTVFENCATCRQVFYVSRVLFGFYMNGVVFCMPILFRYSILTEIQGNLAIL